MNAPGAGERMNCARCVFHVTGRAQYSDPGNTQDNFCAHPAYIESIGVPQYVGTTRQGEPIAPQPRCLLQEPVHPLSLWKETMMNLEFWAHLAMRAPSWEMAKQLREQEYRRQEI